jgi:hypothetical protein
MSAHPSVYMYTNMYIIIYILQYLSEMVSSSSSTDDDAETSSTPAASSPYRTPTDLIIRHRLLHNNTGRLQRTRSQSLPASIGTEGSQRFI